MGIYLGSNDISGGGSSGGGALPDPTYMTRYAHSLSYPALKSTTSAILYASSSSFWTRYNLSFDSVNITTNNVYTTIVDITSAANGGKLAHVIGPAGNTTNQTDFKITIDGTEYLFSYDGAGYANHRATLGVNLGRAATSSGYTSSWLNSNNNHYAYFPSNATNASSTNGGFIFPCNRADLEPIASVSMTIHDAPYVKFENSCKVEIRTSSVATSYANAGAATLLL